MKKPKYTNNFGVSIGGDGKEVIIHFKNRWYNYDEEEQKAITVNDTVAEIQMSFSSFESLANALADICKEAKSQCENIVSEERV